MPRKQKPPGYENWTWDEINLGRKLSKAEKRNRRLAQHLGGTKDKNGDIHAPEGSDSFLYYFVFGLLFIMSIVVIIANALD